MKLVNTHRRSSKIFQEENPYIVVKRKSVNADKLAQDLETLDGEFEFATRKKNKPKGPTTTSVPVPPTSDFANTDVKDDLDVQVDVEDEDDLL